MFHVDMFRNLQLPVSLGDLQILILSSQWRWSELQWEPKQLLQPVLVSLCPTWIHNVDARSVWCQLAEHQIMFQPSKLFVHPQFTPPPKLLQASSSHYPLMLLWICKWSRRPLTRTQWWTGISILFRLEINWNWGTLWAGGVVIEGNIIKAVYCRDNPDILEQPRGASLFVRSSVGFEKTWSQSSVCFMCVWGRAVTLGFLSSGAVAVFSKTMWPCAVRVNTIGWHAVQLWCEASDCWLVNFTRKIHPNRGFWFLN